MFVVFSVYEHTPLFHHDSEEFCKELVNLHNSEYEKSDKDIKKIFPKKDLLNSVTKSISDKESVITSLKNLIKSNVNVPSNQSILHKVKVELKELYKKQHDLNDEYQTFKNNYQKKVSENPDVNNVLKILSDEGEIYYDIIKTFEEYYRLNFYKL